MSSGKLHKKGDRHKCRKPVNWFGVRLKEEDVFVCKCGREYEWTYRYRYHETIWYDRSIEYYWARNGFVEEEC